MSPSCTVSGSADLSIKVLEKIGKIQTAAGPRTASKAKVFHVDRKVIVDASEFFKNLLSSNWKESGQEIVEMKDEIARMEVIFKVLHKVSCTDVKIDIMWPLIMGIDKLQLGIKPFQHWFAQWYDKHENLSSTSPSLLLWPTWRYDEAKAFHHATRRLVYGEGEHIMESNPTKLAELHLPERIIQQMNAARGRLRNLLYHGLLEMNGLLLEATCVCRKETLFDYEHHLLELDVWPLEEKMRKCSINDVLGRLDDFSFEADPDACYSCRKPYNDHVERLLKKIRNYFGGLCLDCMDKSKTRYRSPHTDYWYHDDTDRNDWSVNCRVVHGEPTWYFSFMGRHEDRTSYNRRERELAD